MHDGATETGTRGQAWLARGGLRPTRQRLALATLLVGDGHNRHVTAESLHQAASRSGEGVSLATIYNTLRAFCEAGLMREITVDGSRSYFDTNMTDHPHFFWEDECRLTDAPASETTILVRLSSGWRAISSAASLSVSREAVPLPIAIRSTSCSLANRARVTSEASHCRRGSCG